MTRADLITVEKVDRKERRGGLGVVVVVLGYNVYEDSTVCMHVRVHIWNLLMSDRVGDDTQSDWSDETPYESDQESSVAIVGESASFEDMSAFYNRVVHHSAGSSSYMKVLEDIFLAVHTIGCRQFDALRQRFLRLLNAVQLPTQAVKILKDLMGTVQVGSSSISGWCAEIGL